MGTPGTCKGQKGGLCAECVRNKYNSCLSKKLGEEKVQARPDFRAEVGIFPIGYEESLMISEFSHGLFQALNKKKIYIRMMGWGGDSM